MLISDEISERKRYAMGKVRMAIDAAMRVLSSLDDYNLSYACSQLQRVEQYAHDARFAADLADLLRVRLEDEAKNNAQPTGQRDS